MRFHYKCPVHEEVGTYIDVSIFFSEPIPIWIPKCNICKQEMIPGFAVGHDNKKCEEEMIELSASGLIKSSHNPRAPIVTYPQEDYDEYWDDPSIRQRAMGFHQ